MHSWLRIIKKIRKARRLTQAEMAATLEIDQSNYSRIEKGETSMTLDQFEIVLNKLQLSAVLIDPLA
jgi:transcriptional regulator with XRE-family HTH domain